MKRRPRCSAASSRCTTNAFDEATLCRTTSLPGSRATPAVLAEATGIRYLVDPPGGSYYVDT
jgi:methylmalonyl-CoA mutase N-terminal domain/subunit